MTKNDDFLHKKICNNRKRRKRKKHIFGIFYPRVWRSVRFKRTEVKFLEASYAGSGSSAAGHTEVLKKSTRDRKGELQKSGNDQLDC